MTSVPVSAPFWPVPITTVGRALGGTVVFVRDGKLHVTCFLKSTFQLVPDGPMQLTQPEDIVLREVPHGDALASVYAPCETIPFSSRVDVLLTGHACAPYGQTISSSTVRLAIHRDDTWLLNKTLHVYGDRNGEEMQAFDRMPVVYERAYGGPEFPYNPFGTGAAPGSSYPNIVHPHNPGAVAGFAPLSLEMRNARLVSNVHPHYIDEQVVEIPPGLDDTYFQIAPTDQWLDSLQGNEWVEVDGMHPHYPRLISRLPGVRGVAKVYGIYPEKPDGVRTVTLRPDILRIDADRSICTVVFRATLGLRDGRSLRTLRIAAAVETEELSLAHLLTAPPMRGTEKPPEKATPQAEVKPVAPDKPAPQMDFDDDTLTGQFAAQSLPIVRPTRPSITDEITVERSLESAAARNMKAARVSTPDIIMEDDTVTHERPLTKAEMERIAAITVQFGQMAPPVNPPAREEKSTLALDIDFSDFDSL